MSPGTEELAGSSNAHAQEVVKAAEEDLRQLIRPRADTLKRIGTNKANDVGLARLFGGDWFSEELLELVGRKGRPQQTGTHQGLSPGVDGG
jgi:hypothetical protein